MHILFLSQILPYPPDAGPRVKTWHVLRYLASEGYRVTLVSFVRPEEEKYVHILKEFCQDVYTVSIKRSRVADIGYWLRSQVSGRPFLIERDDLVEMRTLVKRIIKEEAVDVLHADQLTMTQFGFPERSPDRGLSRDEYNDSVHLDMKLHRVFDAHNAVWTIVNRMRQNAPWYLKPIAGLEEQRVKRYEGEVISKFDHTLAVTDPDKEALESAIQFYDHGLNYIGNKVIVVPIAVDTKQLQPIKRKTDSTNILTLGTLHYPPNADGVRWFTEQVFPLIQERKPETTLTIIGKNPPADFYQLPKKYPEKVEVTGYVEDLTSFLEDAALLVIPVRAGGGMRVRILEAFARGMPVVTTTIGLEGIDAESGEQVLVEDDPAGFAKSVNRLLDDKALCSYLAEKGRLLAEERYDWQVVLSKMDQIYKRQAPKEGAQEMAYV